MIYSSTTQAGAENNVDPKTRSPSTSNLVDDYNTFNVVTFKKGKKLDTTVTQDYINALQQQYGQDFINVFFFDYVNKVTVPFRAFITNLTEDVSPEYADNRYIGRIERNVVYVGVNRSLSFQLKIFAMSKNELEFVWRKINYVTGLCYPSDYNTGFMVPPLVKLTVGDVYKDQPGYIRSLTNMLDDDTPWEITPGSQAPMGITLSVNFSVLEKTQVRTSTILYPVHGLQPTTANSGQGSLFIPNNVADSPKLPPVQNPLTSNPNVSLG
jgi:hypothetical protein